MASTCNKNSPADYCLEQRQNNQICDDRTYKYRRIAYNSAIPCVGVNVGGMPNTTLSYNPTNIESSLYGIGSTNLVTHKPAVVPELKKLPNVAFFTRPHVLLPNPLVIEKNQRPVIP